MSELLGADVTGDGPRPKEMDVELAKIQTSIKMTPQALSRSKHVVGDLVEKGLPYSLPYSLPGKLSESAVQPRGKNTGPRSNAACALSLCSARGGAHPSALYAT